MYELIFDTKSGLCEVKDKNTSETVSRFKTAYTYYNTQYPPPISDDGKFIVLGDWEKATYCYNAHSGELIWKKGPGKVRHIFFSLDNKSIICHMGDRGIYRRDVADGEIIDTIKMTGIRAVFFDNTRTWLFAGPKYSYYFIHDSQSLDVTHKIPSRDLNTSSCLSFVIRSVTMFSNQSITITGFEQYPNRNYNDKTKQEYVRTIDLSKYLV